MRGDTRYEREAYAYPHTAVPTELIFAGSDFNKSLIKKLYTTKYTPYAGVSRIADANTPLYNPLTPCALYIFAAQSTTPLYSCFSAAAPVCS